MATLEELLTDGAPSNLLDPVTEVLYRDPVRVENDVYSRSTLVDLGWKNPITRESLLADEIQSADAEAAAVERYIGVRLRDKIKPLLLDVTQGRHESDVDLLLELLKAFERRSGLACVREACASLAVRLDALCGYEMEMVLASARSSLLSSPAAEESLAAFCRQHCGSHVVQVLDDTAALLLQQNGLGDDFGHSAYTPAGITDQLEDFSPFDDRRANGRASTATSSWSEGGHTRHADRAGNRMGLLPAPASSSRAGKRRRGVAETYASPAPASSQHQPPPPRPLMSDLAPRQQWSPQQPAPSVATAHAGRAPSDTLPADQVYVLQLKGMPLDIETKQVTVLFRKYQRDLDSMTVARLTSSTSVLSLNFTSYDSACGAMKLLLGVTFEGLRPDMTLETVQSSSKTAAGALPPPPTTTTAPPHAAAPHHYYQQQQQPPATATPAAATTATPSPHHRQVININRWMYSVWMGNLPRPVSVAYERELIAALAPLQGNILGTHVHATEKGKYLFVDLDSEAAARQAVQQLRGKVLGKRAVAAKFSKKRLVYRAGSAHREPLNLVTLFVTNIASERLAAGFLAEQCHHADVHAIDIPLPFKRMAFFQFSQRAHAQRALAAIQALQHQQQQHRGKRPQSGVASFDEVQSLSLVVNADTQDLIASDRLTDIHGMITSWDRIQAGGRYPRQPPPPPTSSSAAPAPATTSSRHGDWTPLDKPSLSRAPPQSAKSPPPVVHGNGMPDYGDDGEEVYESDEDDFLEMYENGGETTTMVTTVQAAAAVLPSSLAYKANGYAAVTSAATTSSSLAGSGGGGISRPSTYSHPTSGLTSLEAAVPASSTSHPIGGSSSGSGGRNVCIEGRPNRDQKPVAIYSPKFRNYKCFAPLSQLQLGYLTQQFHQQRSRIIANAFNRLQSKYGVILQFDKASNRYFFHSQDEEAVTEAALEMAQWPLLHETSIHLCAHQSMLEHLEQDVVPGLAKRHQVHAHVRSSKHTGCKMCQACAAPVDPAMEQRFPSLKWDKHQWHIIVAVCGEQENVALVEKHFTAYSPLNLSFGLSAARMQQLREAARIRYGSLANLFQHLEDSYNVVIFHHNSTLLAVTGLLSDYVIRCTTELYDLASLG